MSFRSAPPKDPFFFLMLRLYKSGDITFSDRMEPELSALAVIDIQRYIAPVKIFEKTYEDTLGFWEIIRMELDKRNLAETPKIASVH